MLLPLLMNLEVSTIIGGGANQIKGRKKKKRRILKLSDFNDRQEYANALAKALAEQSVPIVSQAVTVEDEELEEEVDALLLATVTRMYH